MTHKDPVGRIVKNILGNDCDDKHHHDEDEDEDCC